jgi:enoyl-CoA hydratase
LLPSAKALAEKIINKGPYAVKLAKETIHNGLELDLERANRYEAEMFSLCFATEDQKEGMAAFLEKRRAKFCGQ